MLLAVLVGFAVLRPVILSEDNLADVSRRGAVLAILATGQAMLVIARGFDLSIGASMAVGGILGATAALSYGTFAGLVVGVGFCVAIGVLNGTLVAVLGLSPLISTLAVMTALRSLALLMTNGLPVYGMPPDFAWAGQATIGPLPTVTAVALVVCAAAIAFLGWAPSGRHLYATGSNPVAARLSGLNPGRILFAAYVVNGLLTGIAGAILTSTLNSGQPNLALGTELQVLAAVFLGGVALEGGRGSLFQVLLAVSLLTILTNGLTLLGVQSYVQLAVSGAVLIVAVVLQRLTRRLRSAEILSETEHLGG